MFKNNSKNSRISGDIEMKSGESIESMFLNGEAGAVWDASTMDGVTKISGMTDNSLYPWRRNIFDWSNIFLNNSETGATYWTMTQAYVSYIQNENRWKFVENTTASVTRSMRKANILLNSEQTFSFYAKAGERTAVMVLVNIAGSISSYSINLLNGEYTQHLSAITSSLQVIDLGAGEYRIALTFTPHQTTAVTSPDYVDIRLLTEYPSARTTGSQYAGDGTSGLFTWNWQLERGTLTDYQDIIENDSSLHIYNPKASLYRSTYGDFPTLEPGTAVRPIADSKGTINQRYNYFDYTEDQTNAYWTTNNITATTLVSENVPSLGRNVNFTRLVENTANSTHSIRRSSFFLGNNFVYTFSALVKAETNSVVCINIADAQAGNPSHVVFDLANGVCGTATSGSTNGTLGYCGMTDMGNGVWEIWWTHRTIASGNTNIDFYMMKSYTLSFSTTTYVGDGTSSLLISGAQITYGNKRPYQAIGDPSLFEWTPGTNLFQINASRNPTYGVMPAHGIRYNDFLYSDNFANAYWGKTNSAIIPNARMCAEEGMWTVDGWVGNATGSTVQLARASINFNSGTYYTVSIRAKSSDMTLQLVFPQTQFPALPYANFDLGAGVVSKTGGGVTATMTQQGDYWICRVTAECTSTGAGTFFFLMQSSPTANRFDNTTVTNGLIHIYGAQLNVGPDMLPFQIVGASSNDYREPGVKTVHYIRFDGVDDGLYTTKNLNLSSTDKLTIFAGVQALSTVGIHTIVESSINSTSNLGTFRINKGASNWEIGMSGNSYVSAEYSETHPSKRVLTVEGASPLSLRIDGVLATPTSSSGTSTSNMSNNLVYVGARADASQRFNGRITQLVILGRQATTSEVISAEREIGEKLGITI